MRKVKKNLKDRYNAKYRYVPGGNQTLLYYKEVNILSDHYTTAKPGKFSNYSGMKDSTYSIHTLHVRVIYHVLAHCLITQVKVPRHIRCISDKLFTQVGANE